MKERNFRAPRRIANTALRSTLTCLFSQPTFGGKLTFWHLNFSALLRTCLNWFSDILVFSSPLLFLCVFHSLVTFLQSLHCWAFAEKVLRLVVFADEVVDFSVQFKVLLAIVWFAQGNLTEWGRDQQIAQLTTIFDKTSSSLMIFRSFWYCKC